MWAGQRISAYAIFKLGTDWQDQSWWLALANILWNTFLFLFGVTTVQPVESQRLDRFHPDCYSALLPIKCQVFLSSFNISPNSRVRNNITLAMLVIVLLTSCYFQTKQLYLKWNDLSSWLTNLVIKGITFFFLVYWLTKNTYSANANEEKKERKLDPPGHVSTDESILPAKISYLLWM